ncbi:unnamed protein product [Adineta steineri]|uniref:LRAT domain-containing protein n=1 Tax=Adineta steineri TaxID=433720 RepID=A0A814DJ53_9BILA|nr:unnamed protein product [Adineta steineri]
MSRVFFMISKIFFLPFYEYRQVFYSYFRPLPIRDILERAENAVGRIGYNLLYNNCEHFATECRYGQATSKQVQAGVSGSVLGLGIILTGAAIFGAYLLSDSSHDEEEKKMKKIQIKS